MSVIVRTALILIMALSFSCQSKQEKDELDQDEIHQVHKDSACCKKGEKKACCKKGEKNADKGKKACCKERHGDMAGKHRSKGMKGGSAKMNTFYQYSIWFAFVNKVFDGELTVRELKRHGDVGLGSFDFLDGELVMLDGIAYRIRENGEVSTGADDDQIVYADAAFFEKKQEFTIEEFIDFESLPGVLDARKKTPHYFYVYKIHGDFKRIKLGGVPKVAKPFTEGLDVLLPKRPVFETENISGTLVGFYCPEYIGHINAKGHHFHFISDDRKWGGHVMEFESSSALQVEVDVKTSYRFDVPATTEFEEVELSKEFQYN